MPPNDQNASRAPNPSTPLARITDQGELLNLPSNLTADQIVFLAEARSLAKRVEKHRPWARQEIFLLLESAVNAGILANDAEKGGHILKNAVEAYQKDLLTRNRLRYVSGTALGVLVLIVLAAGSVALARLGWVTSLATPEIIVALFAFAGIGSVTSLLTRLSTLDLKEETSKAMLMLSGASKPLVAIAFTSIVYIVLKYKLVSITIGSSEAAQSSDAAFWVAAFLCGFSERFASDIITRLDPKAEADAKSA
jgi:hypothetical protein